MKTKYLHTMIRVGNLQKAIEFYTRILGFEHVRTTEHADGKFSLAFLKIEGAESPCLELTYNWGVENYDLGKGYGHMAFAVPSMSEFAQHIAKQGVAFSWGPSTSPSGDSGMAFLKDPDGYSIEILSEKA